MYIDIMSEPNAYGLQMHVTFIDGPTTPSAELKTACEWSCFDGACTWISPGYGQGGWGATSNCWETTQNMGLDNVNIQYVVDVSSNNIDSSMCSHIDFYVEVAESIERINLCDVQGGRGLPGLVPTGNLNVMFNANWFEGQDMGFVVSLYPTYPQPDCYGTEEIGNGVRLYRWSAPRAGKKYLGRTSGGMCEKVVKNVNRKKKQCIRFRGKINTPTSCGDGHGDYLLISASDDPTYADAYPICGSYKFDVTSYGNTMRAMWLTDDEPKKIAARVRGFTGVFDRVECQGWKKK